MGIVCSGDDSEGGACSDRPNLALTDYLADNSAEYSGQFWQSFYLAIFVDFRVQPIIINLIQSTTIFPLCFARNRFS